MSLSGPLTEATIADYIRPHFSKVLSSEKNRQEIYLCNHSLGRPLNKSTEDVAKAMQMWIDKLDLCWEEGGWLDEINLWRHNTAKLIGAPRQDCIIPKTSAGQGLRAVLNSFPVKNSINVVTTTGEFDSIDFILKCYEYEDRANVTWVGPSSHEGSVLKFDAEKVIENISPETDLVVVSHTFFSTGQILSDLKPLIEAAHKNESLILVDFYHAAGVVPLNFNELDADFAIGGSYKYLRGGPGACWLAIHPRHLDENQLATLDTGWFAKLGTFDYERGDKPARKPGGDGWLESTPAILGAYQAKAGLEFTLEVGVEKLREYSLQKQSDMRQTFESKGVNFFQPGNPNQWGAFSLLANEDAPTTVKQLRESGLNTDARHGHIRFCPDVLNTQEEFDRTAGILHRQLSV